jgi:DNA-binding transcriptional ArsR family regulator
MAVRPLAERFPISRPAVSRHLRILTEAGVLTRRRSGRENHYRVEPAALKTVHRWLRSLWSERLYALKSLVEEEAP